MLWKKPIAIETCLALEINGYALINTQSTVAQSCKAQSTDVSTQGSHADTLQEITVLEQGQPCS